MKKGGTDGMNRESKNYQWIFTYYATYYCSSLLLISFMTEFRLHLILYN